MEKFVGEYLRYLGILIVKDLLQLKEKYLIRVSVGELPQKEWKNSDWQMTVIQTARGGQGDDQRVRAVTGAGVFMVLPSFGGKWYMLSVDESGGGNAGLRALCGAGSCRFR